MTEVSRLGRNMFEESERYRLRAYRQYWLIDAQNKSVETAAWLAAHREEQERARLRRETAEREARIAAWDAKQQAKQVAPARVAPARQVERRSMTVPVGQASAPASGGRRVISSTVTKYGSRPCRETVVEEHGARVLERHFLD